MMIPIKPIQFNMVLCSGYLNAINKWNHLIVTMRMMLVIVSLQLFVMLWDISMFKRYILLTFGVKYSVICLCASFSNAILKWFFSQMNLIKTTIRNRLTNESLNSLLCIWISGISLNGFHNNYFQGCVAYWFNKKNRCVTQHKQKLYKKNKNKKKRLPNFSITDSSSDSSVSYSSESDENIL